jgi:hypothetical protein
MCDGGKNTIGVTGSLRGWPRWVGLSVQHDIKSHIMRTFVLNEGVITLLRLALVLVSVCTCVCTRAY